MASNSASLSSLFGQTSSSTGDMGRKAGAVQTKTLSTATNMNMDSLLSIPVLIAIGVVLWFALHES